MNNFRTIVSEINPENYIHIPGNVVPLSNLS